MSVRESKTKSLARRISDLYQRELREPVRWKRFGVWVGRWALMLYHEYVRDNVKIRAESLAYLMLFSLLPLLAGSFFIVTVLAQFGMVQTAIENMVEQLMSNIPQQHHEFIENYILKAKDAYLTHIQEKSGSLGIFALFILAWVGLQTFSNIDRTLNSIWSSEYERPFSEKARNFIVVAVLAPTVMIGTFSIPLILKKIPWTAFLFDRLPLLGVLLNYGIPLSLVFMTFAFMYRYVPVKRVPWRAAVAGAVFSTVLFQLANLGMRVYFSLGTHTYYGKAAVVPLVALWIHLVWIVVILGSEVSFLIERQRDLLVSADESPTFREGRGLLFVLADLYNNYKQGRPAATLDKLTQQTGLSGAQLKGLMDYLKRKGWVVEVIDEELEEGQAYVLAKDPGQTPVGQMLIEYCTHSAHKTAAPMEAVWQQSLEHWSGYFKNCTIADLAGAKPKKKG